MNRPTLVFGATGLLGRHLIQLLHRKGKFPVAVVHNRKAAFPPGVPTFKAAIADAENVRKTIARFRPEVIINCAAYTDVDGCERDPDRARRVNTVGVENIVKAATELNTRLIQISTDYVFDGASGPYDETARPHPINIYGKTKHDAETVVRNADISALIIRAASFIGAGTEKHPCFVEKMISALRSGTTLQAPIDQIATVADVPTLAECILAADKQDITGLLHLGTSGPISRYDLAVLAAEVFGLDESLVEPVMYTDTKRTADRPLQGGLIVNRAEGLLGRVFPTNRATLERLREITVGV